MESFLNEFFINVSCVKFDQNPAVIHMDNNIWEDWLKNQFRETGIVWVKRRSKEPKSLNQETGMIGFKY